jgi:hypothetical protein
MCTYFILMKPYDKKSENFKNALSEILLIMIQIVIY